MLQEGQRAPDFTLLDQEGKPVSLSALRGKKVVLYFYPRDNTPGCTREACSFRDHLEELARYNAVVLGISPDTVRSHQNFARKLGLNFSILADPEKQVLQAYGVWQEKVLYGRPRMGAVRSTFILDEEGVVRKVFPQVQVEGHWEEVLEALKALEEGDEG